VNEEKRLIINGMSEGLAPVVRGILVGVAFSGILLGCMFLLMAVARWLVMMLP
jgi:hypothetical protein